MKLTAACIVAALILLILPNTRSDCPTTIYAKKYNNGRCYIRVTSPKTWQDAKEYCESVPNGRLVAVNGYWVRLALNYWVDSGLASWTSGYSNDTLPAVTTASTTMATNSGTVSNNTSDATTTVSLRTSTESLRTTTSLITRGTTLAPMTWYWSDPHGVDTQISSFYWTSTPVRRSGPSCLGIGRTGSYHSVDCSESRRFICEYVCKYHINGGNTTTIASPGFPSNSNNASCEWFVDVGEGKAVLDFSFFKLGDSIGSSCSQEYILVAENASTISRPLGRFCGSSIPQEIESPSQFLYILFVTDPYVTYESFQATVRSSNVPKTKLLDGKHGVVTSSKFPQNYSSNQTTNWLISVTDGYVILNFTEFNLQSSADCVFDRLEIRELSSTGRLISTLCGTTLPEGIQTNSSVVHLSLISNDDETQGAGFRIIYSSSTASCVHIINSGGGVVTSPGYPRNSAPNESCVWYIDVMDGLALLNITDLHFQYPTDCLQYRLEIWDGQLNNGSRIDYLCGYYIPKGLTFSRSRYLTLFFKSHYRSNDDGFRATFHSSSNCSQRFNASHGVLLSPNYPSSYYPYSNCTWIIDVLSGNATLEFNSFSIQYHETCANDKIAIYDGNTTDAPSLGEFCGHNNPGRFVSSGRYILVHFIADGSIYSSRFSAEFRRSDLNCPMFLQMDSIMIYNNTCYGYSKRESSTFTSAQRICEERNASSVFIESRGEFDALMNWTYGDYSGHRALSFHYFWTSAKKRNNKWFWQTYDGDVPASNTLFTDYTWEAIQFSPSPAYAHIRMGLKGLFESRHSERGTYALCKERSLADSTEPQSKHGCTAPPNIRYGYYNPFNTPYFTNGSSVTYECIANFEFQSSITSTLTCINGYWNGNTPVCTQINQRHFCFKKPDVAFGRFIPSRPYHRNGAVIRLECFDGYELVNPKFENLTCLLQHWHGYIPSCISSERIANTASESGCSGSDSVVKPQKPLALLAGVVWFFIKFR